MAQCAYCSSTILFGGVQREDLRFCNDECAGNGVLVLVGRQLPDDEVMQATGGLHRGPCPRCHGRGPVDVHTTYRVWSALIVTSWSSRPNICCQGCGTRQRVIDTLFCATLGWWGLPWGVLMTPVQTGRNLFGFFTNPDPSRPSPALAQIVRLQLAAHAVRDGVVPLGPG